MDEDQRQAIIDEEHLSLLRIGYFISCSVTALTTALGLFYASMGWTFGAMVGSMPTPPGTDYMPPDFGRLFIVVGLAISLLGAVATGLKLCVARCLKRRRARGFCLVVAAISCFEMPYGTALGVLTIIALSRPSVRRMFGHGSDPGVAGIEA